MFLLLLSKLEIVPEEGTSGHHRFSIDTSFPTATRIRGSVLTVCTWLLSLIFEKKI